VASNIASAMTSAGFGYNLGFSSLEGKSVLNVSVFCNFNKNASWVKDEGRNDYILHHEQHHFDISYICTMEFIKKLKNAHFTSSNYQEILKNLYIETAKEMAAMQDLYDTETQHGIIKNKQQEWSDKIDKQLQALNTAEQ